MRIAICQLVFCLSTQKNYIQASHKHQMVTDLQSLTKIRQKINYLLVSQSFDSIARSYRSICSMITYFLNSFRFTNCSQLKIQLHQCIRLLNIMVDSSQFLKYGHKFPLFRAVIQKYQRGTCQKLRAGSQQTLKRMTKNSQSSYFRSLDPSPITSDQQKFITAGKIDQFLYQLLGCSNVLPDNQCLCCSQVFIRDFQLRNSNPEILNILELNKKNNIDKLVIQRYVNALCNKGGGVILIGLEKKNQCRRVTGIRFKNWEEVEKKQKEILSAFGNIRPTYKYSVQRVMVHTNFLRGDNPSEEWIRVCFRIVVTPHSSKKLSYIELIKNGFKTSYEIYLLDRTQTVNRVNPEDFYKNMHEYYYSRRCFQVNNSHKNISCFKPYNDISSSLKTYINLGRFKQQDLIFQDEAEEKVDQFEQILPILDDNPKFKYKNTTLLVVTSKKNERYIELLKQRLTMKKKAFELFKPFEKSFNLNGGRSVWLISHQISFAQLKNLITCAQKQNVLKPGAFKMMSVSKQMKIQIQKLTPFHQQNLIQKLQQRFGQTYSKTILAQISNQDEDPLQKQLFSLVFNDYTQSIYAFMILEQKQLRPHFIKDTTTFKPVGYGY